MPQIERNGVKLSYRVTDSDGPPVLFVHGFPLDSALWDPQIEALGEAYRCITPDLMGFGDSDAPDDPDRYSMDSYAYDLIAILDDCEVERAAVCGLSMGGYVTFALLERAPERVNALVFADTRAEPDTPEGVATRTEQQDRVRAEGPGFLVDLLVGGPVLSDHTREHKPDVVEQARRVMDNPAAGFIGALEAIKLRPDSSELLPRIDVPTLFVVGENDAITPPEISRDMHSRVSGSQLAVVPDAGHLSNIESPAAFNGALAGLLGSL